MAENREVIEARRALSAMYLMVPEAVALDVNRKVQAAFASLTREPLPAVGAAGEAVAWAIFDSGGEYVDSWRNRQRAESCRVEGDMVAPLYAHPPRVGVTEAFPVPDGYAQIASNVYVSADRIVVTGTPSDVEDENDPAYHNCDAMGCRWEHVIYTAALTRPTSEGREDAIPDEWSSDSAYRRRGRQ